MRNPADGVQSPTLQIKLPYKVHCFAGLMVLVLLLVAWKADQHLGSAMAAIATLAAYYAAFYGRRAIVVSHDGAVIRETINFSRLYSIEPVCHSGRAIKKRFSELYSEQEGEQVAKRRAAISRLSNELAAYLEDSQNDETSEALANHSLMMLDYFEDLAVGIEDGVFRDETAKKLLKAPLNQYWSLLENFVRHYQERSNDTTLYEGVQKLHEKWA